MIVTHSEMKDSKLGNQLFQIASTIGIARSNGFEFVFPPWRYSSFFANPVPQRSGVDCQAVHPQTHFGFYPVRLASSTDLSGYFQSEKFFADCRAEIRYFFALKDEFKNYIGKKYAAVLSGETCSLHVRRGDYLKWPYHHPLLPIRYYDRAMSLFKEETRFIVCSDDIQWCKDNLKGRDFYFVEGEDDIIDLFIMSACKNHIIANSSFSWWSAWLNDDDRKIVICPSHRNWFGTFYRKYDVRDLLPNGWVQIFLPGSFFMNRFLFRMKLAYERHIAWPKRS